MKRILVVLLSVALLASSFQIMACADSGKCVDREALISRACSIFPEYASKIKGQMTRGYTPNASNSREIVRSETRALSENQDILYVEYSDGLVLLAESGYEKSLNIWHQFPVSGGTEYEAYIVVTLSYSSEYFQASNIEYVIYDNDYDSITNAGDLCDNMTSSASFGTIKYSEDANGSAYANYWAQFKSNYGTPPYEAVIKLTVGNNQAYVTVN